MLIVMFGSHQAKEFKTVYGEDLSGVFHPNPVNFLRELWTHVQFILQLMGLVLEKVVMPHRSLVFPIIWFAQLPLNTTKQMNNANHGDNHV